MPGLKIFVLLSLFADATNGSKNKARLADLKLAAGTFLSPTEEGEGSAAEDTDIRRGIGSL